MCGPVHVCRDSGTRPVCVLVRVYLPVSFLYALVLLVSLCMFVYMWVPCDLCLRNHVRGLQSKLRANETRKHIAQMLGNPKGEDQEVQEVIESLTN